MAVAAHKFLYRMLMDYLPKLVILLQQVSFEIVFLRTDNLPAHAVLPFNPGTQIFRKLSHMLTQNSSI